MKKLFSLLVLLMISELSADQIRFDTKVQINQDEYNATFFYNEMMQSKNGYVRFTHDSGFIIEGRIIEMHEDEVTLEFRMSQVYEDLPSKQLKNGYLEAMQLIAQPVLKLGWNSPGRVEIGEKTGDVETKKFVMEVVAIKE